MLTIYVRPYEANQTEHNHTLPWNDLLCHLLLNLLGRIPCLIYRYSPRDDSGPNKEVMLNRGMNEQMKYSLWLINWGLKKKSKRILQNVARWIIGLTAVAVISFWGQERGG